MSNAVIEDLLKLRSIIEQRDAEIAALQAERDDLLNGHNKYSSDPTKCCVPATEYLRLQNTTRRLVEALETVNPWCMVSHKHVTCDLAKVQDALADPVIVALRRE